MRASAVSILVLSALALLPAAGQAAPRTVATCDGARLDKAAGVARSLSDCGSADMRRGAEGAARQAVGRLSGALGVRRDTRDLAPAAGVPDLRRPAGALPAVRAGRPGPQRPGRGRAR